MFIRRNFSCLVASLMLVAFVLSGLSTTLAARRKPKEKAAAEKKHPKQKESARKAESPKAGKKRGRDNEAAAARHTRDRKGKKGKQAAEDERTLAKSKSQGKAADRRAAALEAGKKNRNDREEKAEKSKRPAEREERTVKAEKAVTEKRVVREQPEAELTPARKGKFGSKAGRDETEAGTNVTSFTIETTKAARESAQPVAAVPDIIEVKEYDPARPGADNSSVARRALRAFNNTDAAPNISSRRIEVSIDRERITEIQQALSQKGFYTGEPTGVWDDVTYDAMKRFQISQRIDATGYPTAHALKRLGLTSW